VPDELLYAGQFYFGYASIVEFERRASASFSNDHPF